jgi:WD40 repeat protein
MKNGKALANVRLGSDTVLALAVSPAGDLIAMIEDEGTLRLRRRDGTAESVPDMGDVISIAFSPNGAYLAAERQEQGVLLWDVKAKRQAWRLAVTGVFDLQFSPDSSHLAFGLEKNITQIWSLKTGRQIARIHHGKAVKVRALGPGGRYLATTGDDGVASIWSIPGGIEIARLAREAAITALAFSPDGKRIAIASEDHTVSVSLWIPEDLINEACSRLTRNLSREEWQAYMGEEPYRQTCRNLPAR